jgi:starch phosphorylase
MGVTVDRLAGTNGVRDHESNVLELGARLPAGLVPLARLAFNYRWAWLSGGRRIFSDLDPGLWHQSCCNPRFMIESTPPPRLAELDADTAFVDRVHRLAGLLDADLARPPAPGWRAEAPVAYFCSEFGVHCSLPIYAGGLGVLAGDLLKTASDLALPMVGVGLAYREGYFHQRIDLSGWQQEYWTRTSFEHLPMSLVTGADGRPLTVDLPIRDRTVHVQAWRVEVGRVPLLLLDTDRDDNGPVDRWITARLYVGDRHLRLAQYAVLGVGGRRMLDALGIRPARVHLNEGHATLAALERLRGLVAGGTTPAAALDAVRAETVFTTHTPVAAGNETYSPDEVGTVLGRLLGSMPMGRSALGTLARVRPDDPGYGITPLALHASGAANAVSRRHGEVARAMWRPLWPEREVEEVPIGHVTNGVHVSTWMLDEMQALLDAHLPEDWRTRPDDGPMWDRLAEVPDAALWEVRCALRARLVEHVREASTLHRLRRGEPHDFVEAAARVFDPGTLTIGFARRVATYKRLYLLTHDLDRAVTLLADGARPIQVLIAGKAHPQDEEAKHTLRGLMANRRTADLGSRVVFLEDYDLHLAPRLIGGCDVWVNLPRPPLEASGTSGMKSVMNGGLQLSVLDGWWDEGFDEEVGWGIRTPAGDPATQDAHDATALFDIIEHEVVPAFYDGRDAAGVPLAWTRRVRTSLRRLAPRFSSHRMVREYESALYGVR